MKGHTQNNPNQNFPLGKIPKEWQKELERLQKERQAYSYHRRQQETLYNSAVRESKKREEKEIRRLIVELQGEIKKLEKANGSLTKEVKKAAVQAVRSQPQKYTLSFVKHLIKVVKSLRKRVEDAADWLQIWNQKQKKKRFWDIFRSKRGGASYLLSSEHYLTRSAG